jgi:retron-type reverse transcriptase
VKSFLEARQQQVQVGKALSSLRHPDIGVPQGSVISPLLFLLYIQDIEQWIKSASITGYADDTSLTMSSWDMKSLLASLETEAAMILDYIAVNKLVANADKTKFLLIRGKRHKKWPEVKIKVGNSLVNESQSEKILGITVNNKLKWDEHHNNITNKHS